jgi:hypothetical protein
MYKQIEAGEMPKELEEVAKSLGGGGLEKHTDADGNPIIDDEGGAVVQPLAGFVVKTKDQTGEKVFVNMTHHSILEGMKAQAVTPEDAAKYGTAEQGVRIPLSLGPIREDRDKRGDPVRVYDFIWATEVVQRAQKEAVFRQQMVELAFTYVQQKFGSFLDLRFTIPKMKYKGDTIQWQRVKAKKGPRIQEVEMTEEERKRVEERAMEEERRREALREKEPDFNLYCIMDKRLNKDFGTTEYIQSIITSAFENDSVGDEDDRWKALAESFEMQ